MTPPGGRRRRAGAWPLALLLAIPGVPQAAGQAGAANGQAVAQREISTLIAGLARSGCRFQRNGSWHDAAEASAHLQRKYDWARKRGIAGDAEDFIERAASRSSFSGRAYRVACPGQPEREAGPWFRQQLDAMRRGAGAG